MRSTSHRAPCTAPIYANQSSSRCPTHCFNRFVPDDADALIIGFSEMCDGKHHTVGFKTQTVHQGFVGVETLMRIALSRPAIYQAP